MLNEEELSKFLKENLKIVIESPRSDCGYKSIQVFLKLNDQLIDSDEIYI